MNESLALLRRLLAGEEVGHEGEFFALDHASIRPAPAPWIPLVVGGRSDAALRRAGRLGDGWLGIWTSARRCADAIAAVAGHAADAGRTDVARHRPARRVRRHRCRRPGRARHRLRGDRGGRREPRGGTRHCRPHRSAARQGRQPGRAATMAARDDRWHRDRRLRPDRAGGRLRRRRLADHGRALLARLAASIRRAGGGSGPSVAASGRIPSSTRCTSRAGAPAATPWVRSIRPAPAISRTSTSSALASARSAPAALARSSSVTSPSNARPRSASCRPPEGASDRAAQPWRTHQRGDLGAGPPWRRGLRERPPLRSLRMEGGQAGIREVCRAGGSRRRPDRRARLTQF
jgi:hypothetical protein